MWKKIAMVLALAVSCAAAWAVTDKQREEIAKRLKPVGEVCLKGDADCGTQAAQAAGGEGRSPEEIYQASCNACHATGVGGAPKLDDAAAWADRMDKGLEEVYANAINGLNAMPPMGTCMNCSEEEIKATVDYMIEQSQ